MEIAKYAEEAPMKSYWQSKKMVALGFGVMLGAVLAFVSCKKAEEKAKEEVVYVVGMEEYVYGFPLVMIDMTTKGINAVPKAGEYYAPMNQCLRMRTFVDPDYKMVVRVSRKSLWSGGAVSPARDLGR